MATDDARRDIARNEFIIKGFGLAAFSDSPSPRERMLAKYHVSETSLGCVVGDLSQLYVEAYNEVVSAEIARRYGADFWERVERESDHSTESRSLRNMPAVDPAHS
jgi:hypothetical protein